MKKLLIATALLAVIVTPVSAGKRVCQVADPTGTPLNVRSQPNGAIVGALHNDTQVMVVDATRDLKWAKVVPIDAGKVGWVFADHLDCSTLY
jgi:hypothetical protein